MMSRPLVEALAPIRKQIKKTAGQLKGLRDRGWHPGYPKDVGSCRDRASFPSECPANAFGGWSSGGVTVPCRGARVAGGTEIWGAT